MGNFEQTLSTCSTVLNYATGHDGILSPAELADLLGVQKEFTGMQDAGKAARENLAAQRKERLGKAVTLRTTLSAASIINGPPTANSDCSIATAMPRANSRWVSHRASTTNSVRRTMPIPAQNSATNAHTSMELSHTRCSSSSVERSSTRV